MTNPLMTPPRTRVVELLPGDVEKRVAELRATIAETAGAQPRRAGSKSPAMQAAEEIDRASAEARERAVKVTLQEVPQRVVDRLKDNHPPRPENERDKALGFNEDAFYWGLVRAAIVDPVVTDEQWAEFVASASPARRHLLVSTAEELSIKDVDLPKSSAVSALRRILESGSTQLDDTE